MPIDAREIVARFDRLDGDRSSVKARVERIQEYCTPDRANVTLWKTEGDDSFREGLYDSTAETACERFATGMYDFMWPPERQNFMLLPPIEDAPDAEDYTPALLDVAQAIHEEKSASNFAEAFYEIAMDWGSAGTATLEVARGDTSLYNYTAYPFEQVVFLENRAGRVDTVLRKFIWTARQIVQEFGKGEDRVGKAINDAYEQAGGAGREESFEIVHAAMPREEFTAGRLDVRNMPVVSAWVAVDDKKLLRESGWPQLRYLVSRFSKLSGFKHGRGPGGKALPDVAMLNEIERATIIAAENVIQPTVLAPVNAFAGIVKKLRPGRLLWYRPNPMNPTIKPEPFNTGGRPDFGVEYADSKRAIIKSIFFNDLFLILSDDKRRTATEVRSLLAEKLSMLGPAFGRAIVECFNPMIRIDASILSEQPWRMRGFSLADLQLARIRYISTLAIAMQFAELSMLHDAWLFLSPLGEIDPTVFDNLSFDEITRGFLQKMAWPTKWLRSRSEVRDLREARAQHQAEQLQMAMAQQQMALMGKLGKRPEAGSPADAMIQEAA